MLEYPLYKCMRDRVASLFESVILQSLKSFFQLNKQVDIHLYLMETTTLLHFRELTGWKPSQCSFNPIFAYVISSHFISLLITSLINI